MNFIVLKRYVDTYCELMHPKPEANLEPRNMNEDIQPPPLKRLPSRPAINGRKELGESTFTIRRSSTLKCGNCGGLGHNRKKCQRAHVAKKKTAPTTMGPQASSTSEPYVSRAAAAASRGFAANTKGRGNIGRGRWQQSHGVNVAAIERLNSCMAYM
ncbi:hypothetical protein CFOL_v3_31077 [Cephalotus follicularis]|uniref:CCHC-type domain-containing protein n=1 Tax=Cephalotus follicularis TaxID=3775 RepID=A0A1Q3D5F3_CEPFO|nr:hypothetical protein CFOL_v3_31077 [Cephalotus follicularis]